MQLQMEEEYIRHQIIRLAKRLILKSQCHFDIYTHFSQYDSFYLYASSTFTFSVISSLSQRTLSSSPPYGILRLICSQKAKAVSSFDFPQGKGSALHNLNVIGTVMKLDGHSHRDFLSRMQQSQSTLAQGLMTFVTLQVQEERDKRTIDIEVTLRMIGGE